MEFRNTDEIKARTGVAKRTTRGGGLSIDREPWKWLPVLRTCKNFNVLEARELSSVVGSDSSPRGKFADVPAGQWRNIHGRNVRRAAPPTPLAQEPDHSLKQK